SGRARLAAAPSVGPAAAAAPRPRTAGPSPAGPATAGVRAAHARHPPGFPATALPRERAGRDRHRAWPGPTIAPAGATAAPAAATAMRSRRTQARRSWLHPLQEARPGARQQAFGHVRVELATVATFQQPVRVVIAEAWRGAAGVQVVQPGASLEG